MELVYENPDSDDIMILLVAEDLMDKLGPNVQHHWVMIVGDGKTYQHLAIKCQETYLTTFEKLLIRPGNWHILENL